MTSIRSLIDWVTGKSESIDSVTGKSESIDSVTEGYSVVDKRLNERREKILETEVVAFRGWDLESDGLEYWLSSPSLTSRWIPNQPNKAVCSEAHQWPRGSRHRSPVSTGSKIKVMPWAKSSEQWRCGGTTWSTRMDGGQNTLTLSELWVLDVIYAQMYSRLEKCNMCSFPTRNTGSTYSFNTGSTRKPASFKTESTWNT